MVEDGSRVCWLKEAARLRRRFNFGWWYQELTVPLVALGLGGGAFALVARRYQWEIAPWFGIAMGVLLVAIAFFAWSRSKCHCLTSEAALVRLETGLGLHNALSTAQAGHASWPPFVNEQKVVRWRWGQLALPLVGAFAFFLLGAMVPIAPIRNEVIENQPYTWSRLETEIEELVAEEVIDEDYAEDLKERLEELREQDSSEWFSAASLEATDSLQQAHAREMNRLERDLMKVQQSLRKAGDGGATEAQRQKMKQQFEEAVEGMRNGQLKPNKKLMEKLEEAAKKGMEGMSEEERQAMKEQMEKLAEQLQKQKGQGDEPGEGEGDQEGDGPPKAGKGEPKRGPGVGGDLFGADSPMLDLEKFEHLEGKEEKEPDPGDLLNLDEIEHELDRSKTGPVQSGSTKNKGLGGDRVWKDSLEPEEQKSLKLFFESSSP